MRDLCVTADHAILIDSVLCHAGALLNDETICAELFSALDDHYTVHQIETKAHGILLANGAPAGPLTTTRGSKRFTETFPNWRSCPSPAL